MSMSWELLIVVYLISAVFLAINGVFFPVLCPYWVERKQTRQQSGIAPDKLALNHYWWTLKQLKWKDSYS